MGILDILKKKPNQESRKVKSEKILTTNGIKINPNLPLIESGKETTLRTAEEIAYRVTVLAILNMVAYSENTGEEATDYLRKMNLFEHTTPDERAFLANPTEERKNQESWKSECIWTLLWALKLVDDLGGPNAICDLTVISSNKYPIGPNNDPLGFIKNSNQTRSITEILDKNDLYYRADWTCVDARVNGHETTNINCGVVYERHYALNWLINYKDQDWDHVSCDT